MENNMQSTTTNLGGIVQNNIPQQSITNNQQGVNNINTVQPQQSEMSTSGYSQPVENNIPQQPVSDGTTITMNNTQPLQSVIEPLNQVNNITEQSVQGVKVEQSSNITTPPVLDDQPVQHQATNEVIIDSKNLQRLVNQVKQVANNENLEPLSQVYYLVVNSDGFRIYASNVSQVVDVIDDTYSYTQEFQIAVNAKKFTDLVMNLDAGQVIFTYNDAQKVLTVSTSTGRFQFTEQVDMGTGYALTIDHRFKVEDKTTMEDLDFNALIDAIKKTRPVRTYAKSLSSQEDVLDGIYIIQDIMLSTDGNFILMQKATQGFADKDIALSSGLVDILTSLSFDTDSVKFSIVTAEVAGDVKLRGIVFTDGKITLSSPLIAQLDQNILDICLNFWNIDYNVKLIFDTKKYLSILKRVAPFIEFGTDDDNLLHTISGNTVRIESLGGSGLDTMIIENTQNYAGSLKLPVQRTQKLLSTITDSTFNLTINPEQKDSVCFVYDEYKCVVSLSN